MTVTVYNNKMSPEECIRVGGHCWERSSFVQTTIPPVYTERCKHCPTYRTGTPQESIKWSEPKTLRPGPGEFDGE